MAPLSPYLRLELALLCGVVREAGSPLPRLSAPEGPSVLPRVLSPWKPSQTQNRGLEQRDRGGQRRQHASRVAGAGE